MIRILAMLSLKEIGWNSVFYAARTELVEFYTIKP